MCLDEMPIVYSSGVVVLIDSREVNEFLTYEIFESMGHGCIGKLGGEDEVEQPGASPEFIKACREYNKEWLCFCGSFIAMFSVGNTPIVVFVDRTVNDTIYVFRVFEHKDFLPKDFMKERDAEDNED